MTTIFNTSSAPTVSNLTGVPTLLDLTILPQRELKPGISSYRAARKPLVRHPVHVPLKHPISRERASGSFYSSAAALGLTGSDSQAPIQDRDGAVAYNRGAADLLNRLYPNGIENAHLKQDRVGNCYLLACLHSFKRNPYFIPWLYKVVEEMEDGWRVHFPGADKPITVTLDDFEQQEFQTLKGREKKAKVLGMGALGDYIISYAYHRYDLQQRRKIRVQPEDGFRTLAIANEGGNSEDVYKVLLNGMAQTKAIYTREYGWDNKEKVREALLQFGNTPHKYLLYASAYINGQGELTMDASEESHAFSVTDVDVRKGIVTVANPWDTSAEREYPIERFLAKFKKVELTELGPAQKLDDFIRDVPRHFMTKSDVQGRLKPLFNYLYEVSEAKVLSIEFGGQTLKLWTRGTDLLLTGFPQRRILEIRPNQTLVIGRDDFGAAAVKVSKNHLEITWQADGKILLRDMQSTNGTSVYYQKIDRPAPLPAPRPAPVPVQPILPHPDQELEPIWINNQKVFVYPYFPFIGGAIPRASLASAGPLKPIENTFFDDAVVTLRLQSAASGPKFLVQNVGSHLLVLHNGQSFYLKAGRGIFIGRATYQTLTHLEEEHVFLYYMPDRSGFIVRDLGKSGGTHLVERKPKP